MPATLVIFVFSRVYRNSSFYDAFWSVILPLLLYQGAEGGLGLGIGALLPLAIVMFYWAIRLTANWVYGFPVCTMRIGTCCCSATALTLGVPGRSVRYSPGAHRAGAPACPGYVSGDAARRRAGVASWWPSSSVSLR